MSEPCAFLVLVLAGAYLAAGVVVALGIEWRGLPRIDRLAGHGSPGFRILIFPGLVALWPLMLRRVVAGRGAPPPERNAHRVAARPPGPSE